MHVALTVLVCARYQRVEHWPLYVVWNLCAIAAILLLTRKRRQAGVWEFAHDWLPAIFFISVFEEISYLSLSLRGDWQSGHIVAFESLWFAVPPALWMHQRAAPWLVQFLEFGYFAFYPLYPVVGGLLWAWRARQPFTNAFRRLTDALSVGYLICYATYLLFPTRSPANSVGVQQFGGGQGGLFQTLVQLIQNHAGSTVSKPCNNRIGRPVPRRSTSNSIPCTVSRSAAEPLAMIILLRQSKVYGGYAVGLRDSKGRLPFGDEPGSVVSGHNCAASGASGGYAWRNAEVLRRSV